MKTSLVNILSEASVSPDSPGVLGSFSRGGLFILYFIYIFLNSGEDQVGFSDKPVIAYLVEKPAALTSSGGSWLTAISGAGTQ